MVGRTLSHYRIVERLGAGGMGEVYRAHDEKLDRDVALKVLPEGALADESARARFRKEAHALSRLSHPHIAHLLDFDSEDGIDFLVMELVTGPSLSEKLREGPLPEKDVLRLGAQLARGLQAAHEQGVIHRDLKPSNLHLTPDGLLKNLDFGPARLLQPKTTPPGHSTATETAAGAIVGSPPYMAPEQLLGKPPDPRTDLYAAGVVLYEMATRQRPFGSRSGVALTDAILHEEPPPPRSFVPAVSPALESVILKALDKDPDLRHQTAKDLLVDLERAQQRNDLAVLSSVGSRRGRTRPWVLAATALALVVLLGGVFALRPLPRITGVRVLASDLKTTSFFSFLNGSWASDGENVYYVAGTGDPDLLGIFHVPVDGGDPVRVQLPSRHYVSLTIHAYVPDEKALLVTSGEDQREDMPDGLPLFLVPVPFGAPRRIPNLLAWGAELSPDGRTLALTDIVGSGPELRWRLVLAGLDGSWQRVVGPLPPRVGRVRWTPDGRRLRFYSRDLELPSWENQIWEMPLEGGEPRPLGPGMGGRWTNDGKYFLFERQGGGALQYDIYVRDESRWLPGLAGATQRLTVGPVSFQQTGPAPDGRQLFAYGHMGRGELRRLDPVTRTWGSLLGGESAIHAEPSPDGEWLAWVRYPDGTLWKSRADGSDRLRLTSPPVEAHQPRWSPDGQRLVFVGRSPEVPQLSVHVVAADGSRSDVIARPPGSGDYWDTCWMPNGRLVISYANWKGGLFEIGAGGGAPRLIPETENLAWHRCSRQGDILAASLDREGARLNVRRAGAAAWEDFGPATISYANWTRDARAFCGYQVDPDARIVCVSLTSGERTTLADNPPFPLIGWPPWMGLDAEDRPMVTADRSTTGFYALDWDAP